MSDSRLIQQLDLNLLRVFRALYYEQNMTRAAEVLNLTPSAVSHAIRRLRDALGEPLFERSQNQMLPTATCRRMAPDLISALNHLQQLLQHWGDFDAASSTHAFRIGIHDAYEPSLFPRLAASIASNAPGVKLISQKLDRHTMAIDLAAGNLDVALDVPLTVSHAVQSRRILNNDFVVARRKHHPLGKELSKKAYLQATHIVVSGRPSGLSMEDTQLLAQSLHRKIHMRCQNYYAALEITRHSDHLLTLPMLLADHFTAEGLDVSNMPIRLPGFATQLYWHENFADDPALRWLRNSIISLYPNLDE